MNRLPHAGQPAVSAWRDAPRQALLALVHGYRLLLKPWIGNACRFEPTCSAYALQALALHGAARGSALTAARILRCHPWCAGGVDPAPPVGHAPAWRLFSRLGLGDAPPAEPSPSSSPPTTPAAPGKLR